MIPNEQPDEETGAPSIAELVKRVFAEHRKPNGEEYSNSEVARAIGVHHSTIQAWRSGKIDNPNRESLKKFALFFNLPASYFFPEIPTIDANPEQTLHIALRQLGIDDEGEQLVRALVKRLKS